MNEILRDTRDWIGTGLLVWMFVEFVGLANEFSPTMFVSEQFTDMFNTLTK